MNLMQIQRNKFTTFHINHIGLKSLHFFLIYRYVYGLWWWVLQCYTYKQAQTHTHSDDISIMLFVSSSIHTRCSTIMVRAKWYTHTNMHSCIDGGANVCTVYWCIMWWTGAGIATGLKLVVGHNVAENTSMKKKNIPAITFLWEWMRCG